MKIFFGGKQYLFKNNQNHKKEKQIKIILFDSPKLTLIGKLERKTCFKIYKIKLQKKYKKQD